MRDNTERLETLEVGSNVLAGVNQNKIVECIEAMLNKKRSWKNPFGDGKAAEIIVKLLTKDYGLRDQIRRAIYSE